MIFGFTGAFRALFGVYPICRALTGHGIAVSPRGYYARLSRPPSRRALRDAWLTGLLRDMFEPGRNGRRRPESLYGAVKAGHHYAQSAAAARRSLWQVSCVGGPVLS